jgi:transcriptional regulator with XRE-family HTH domain
METRGEYLKRIRKERNITQTTLAHKAGVSISLVSCIEDGKRRMTYETARLLGRALGESWKNLYDPRPKAQGDSA